MTRTRIPVLEIGGTHVTAAFAIGQDVSDQSRTAIDCHAAADVLLDSIAAAGTRLGNDHDGHWGIAIPGPFDYESGIGRFENVGKFDSLNNVDVASELASRLPSTSFTFLNDVTAFGVGEDTYGAGQDSHAALYLTFGTGVGSCFIRDGQPVDKGDDVPHDGHVHYLQRDGKHLEDYFSRRALMKAWHDQTGDHLDVKEICDLATAGDARAVAVVESAYRTLGELLRPWVDSFGAERIVIGGSIAQSWNLVEAYFTPVVSDRQVPCVPAALPDTAGIIGAGRWVELTHPTA